MADALEQPCCECGRMTIGRCEHCDDNVCAACYEDHTKTHGDVENLEPKASTRSDGLIEGTPDELGL